MNCQDVQEILSLPSYPTIIKSETTHLDTSDQADTCTVSYMHVFSSCDTSMDFRRAVCTAGLLIVYE